jgi:arylsulfatase A-like enzyme
MSAQAAALIFGFVVTEILLTVGLNGGFFFEPELPFGARLLIFTYAIAILVSTLWCLDKFASLSTHFGTSKFVIGRCLRFCVRCLFGALIFLYALSWALFWQVGKFLDTEAVRFWLTQPLQVFHWIDADVSFVVIGVTVVLGLAIFRWLPRWSFGWPVITQHWLVQLVGIILATCTLGAVFGEIFSTRKQPAYLRSNMVYRRARDEMSTPLAHLYGTVRAAFRRAGDELPDTTPIKIIRRKILPIEKYIAAVDQSKVKRWNVIVLIVESLRSDQLRVYGNGNNVMPTLDSLAQESRVFTNVHSQSSQTSYAVFAPLSSHYPLRSAGPYSYSATLTYPRVLIHNVLKKLGYRTAVFSSSNENWEGMIHYLQSGDIDHFFHASVFKGPTYNSPGDTRFANWVMRTRYAGSVDDRFTVSEAIEWIDGAQDQPFYLYMNLQNSHVPYRVPDDFPRRFSTKEINFTIRFGYFPRDKVDIVKGVYSDSLAYVDSQIGRLFDHLRQRGFWDKTLIVVTGDHGQAFYEHGLAAHAGPLFEEVMKVPLLIHAPGLVPSKDGRPAQHIDVPPSVLALLGLPPHPSFQGINLFDPTPNPDRSVFMVTQNALARQYGIIRSGWKLIYDEQRLDYLLFNLTSDPGETLDLATTEKIKLQQLAARLHAWRSMQIKYYSDVFWHTHEYPPILDEQPLCDSTKTRC